MGLTGTDSEHCEAHTRRLTPLLILAGIMLGGLLLRLIFYNASVPFGGEPFIRDEGNYVGLAVPLSQGQGFVDKWVWVRPPGYPMFVAAFLVMFGGNLSAAALGQILLSVAGIGMVYFLTLEVFGRRPDVPRGVAEAVGLVAAGLMALNPHAALYANLIMPESLYMLALTVVAWALLRAIRLWVPAGEGKLSRAALWLVALAAVVSALAILLRSLFLTFTPLLLAWFWWVLPRQRGREAGVHSRLTKRAFAPLALFVVLMFAVIVPWTVRNYFHYGEFLLVDTMAGYNLWQFNDNIGVRDIQSRLMQIPDPVERERYASQQGIRAITSDIPGFVRTAVGRFADSWPVDRYSEFRFFLRDKYPGTDALNLDIFAWVGTLFYVAFGVLAIWGFALAPGRTFKGLVLLLMLHYAATTMFAHAEFRYRIPLYPFASLYGGWALVALFARVRGVRQGPGVSRFALWGAAVVSIVFVVQCAFFALPGLPNSIRYERRYLDGVSKLNSGDYSGALTSFTGASEIDATCACLYRNIGLAYAGLGEHDKERAAYNTAITKEEHDWRTRALLSDSLRAAGDPRAANPVLFTRPPFREEQQRWAWEHLSSAPPSSLDVGGADIGFVRDFQAPETEQTAGGATVSYRWSTDRSQARLAVPPGSGPLKLAIRWHSLAWPGKPDPDTQVHVLVNGRDAGTLIAHPGWETATLDLPDVVASSPVVIELQTSVQRAPGEDTRQLGVAVDTISLQR